MPACCSIARWSVGGKASRSVPAGDAVVDAHSTLTEQPIPGRRSEDPARCQLTAVRGQPVGRSRAQRATVEQDDTGRGPRAPGRLEDQQGQFATVGGFVDRVGHEHSSSHERSGARFCRAVGSGISAYCGWGGCHRGDNHPLDRHRRRTSPAGRLRPSQSRAGSYSAAAVSIVGHGSGSGPAVGDGPYGV